MEVVSLNNHGDSKEKEPQAMQIIMDESTEHIDIQENLDKSEAGDLLISDVQSNKHDFSDFSEDISCQNAMAKEKSVEVMTCDNKKWVKKIGNVMPVGISQSLGIKKEKMKLQMKVKGQGSILMGILLRDVRNSYINLCLLFLKKLNRWRLLCSPAEHYELLRMECL